MSHLEKNADPLSRKEKEKNPFDIYAWNETDNGAADSIGVDVEVAGTGSFGFDLRGNLDLANYAKGSTATLATSSVSAVEIAAGGDVDIDGPGTNTATFLGSSGTLEIDDSSDFDGDIVGLSGADTLDLAAIGFSASTQATFVGNASSGVLTVSDGAETAKIELTGDYLSSSWSISSDGTGGTNVVDPTVPTNWQVMKVGAGGFADGLDEAADGTLVVRTDTNGAYLWNGSSWVQLVTASSMPAAFIAANPESSGQGVYEIQIAPNNSNVMYMMFDGEIFTSANKGTTWSQTSFAQVVANPNDSYRWYGQKMAVDPNNSNIVYVGTPQNGLWMTSNGGLNWSLVGAVPFSEASNSGFPGITGITFDPAVGGVVNGVTQTIFASSYGNGVYESTNGGSSWSKLSGGPSDVEFATVGPNGAYYAVGDGNKNLWRYYNGTWTELVAGNNGQGVQAVLVNPINPNEIVAVAPSGYLNVSYNGGTTWSGIDWSIAVQSNDIPWEAEANTQSNTQSKVMYLDVGGAAFSTSNPNELILSTGTGSFDVSVPTTSLATTLTYQDNSEGIENLVANEILVAPGGVPILASWDRPFIQINNLGSYPTTYGPIASDQIVAGWSVDYASSTPTFLVGIADWWGVEESGYSTNGGQTWTPFATELTGGGTAFIGGSIAASTTQNFIWAPADGNQPYYTTNGGNTWNPITLPGVGSWSNFDTAYYLTGRSVTADRVTANTFYLYDNGVFETTNGGQNWTEVYTGAISPGALNSEIMAVPGMAGNLYFTAGIQGNGSSPPSYAGFYFSNTQGKTWTAVSNVLDVSAFGFGAAAPGQSYPAIYIVGYVDNVQGVWQSTNQGQSWARIGTQPAGELDQITTISGDPNTFGQVYVGFSGGGYAYLSGETAVTNVTATPSNGVEVPGDAITFTVNMSEAVTVSGGTPTLNLNDGGAATYASGSGSTALVFTYTVAASDKAVSALAISSVSLNGATVDDSSGNVASLAGAVTTFNNIAIDPPFVFGINESPASGDLGVGKTVNITLTVSDIVTVSGGTPTLQLNDGGVATYTSGSGTKTLAFSYTVGASDTNVSSLLTKSINLNGATIQNGAGASMNLAITGITQVGPQIDTKLLVVTAIAESPSSGQLNVGASISFTLTFSDTVIVSNGTPTLTLNDGGVATYTGGSGSNTVTFAYVVGAGQATSSLAASAVNLNGATIANGAGTTAALSLLGVSQTGPAIDTITPSVTSLLESPASGALTTGANMTLTLGFSDNIVVSGGVPSLALNDGGVAVYTGGSGSNTLTFSYVVGTSQTTNSLAATAVNLNGASIAASSGVSASLSLLDVSQSGPAINPGAISISSIVDSSSSGNLGTGATLTLSVQFSSAVVVSGGTPYLSLNSGGVATFAGGSGTKTLTFSYQVGSNQIASSLAVSAITLNGASINGYGGRVAQLSLTGVTQAGPAIWPHPWTSGGYISGSSVAFDLASHAWASVTGMDDNIWATSVGDSLTFGGNGQSGVPDGFHGSSSSLNLLANAHLTVSGSSNSISLAQNARVSVSGSNNWIGATSDDIVGFSVGTGNSVSAFDDTIWASANVTVAVSGSYDVIEGSLDDVINVFGGGHYNLSGSSVTYTLGSISSASLSGADDTINPMSRWESLSIGGNGVTGAVNAIKGAYYETLLLRSNSNTSVSGAYNSVTMQTNSAATIVGSEDSVTVSSGAELWLSSATATTIDVGNLQGGTVTFEKYGPANGDIINLIGDVGGYGSGAATFKALESDGVGGSLLSLGTAGTLHFLGVAPSSLSSSDFTVG